MGGEAVTLQPHPYQISHNGPLRRSAPLRGLRPCGCSPPHPGGDRRPQGPAEPAGPWDRQALWNAPGRLRRPLGRSWALIGSAAPPAGWHGPLVVVSAARVLGWRTCQSRGRGINNAHRNSSTCGRAALARRGRRCWDSVPLDRGATYVQLQAMMGAQGTASLMASLCHVPGSWTSMCAGAVRHGTSLPSA